MHDNFPPKSIRTSSIGQVSTTGFLTPRMRCLNSDTVISKDCERTCRDDERAEGEGENMCHAEENTHARTCIAANRDTYENPQHTRKVRARNFFAAANVEMNDAHGLHGYMHE